MEKFIVVLFIYSMYMISMATIILWVATIFIPITDWVYNSQIMGVILTLLWLQLFAVSRKLIDKPGK